MVWLLGEKKERVVWEIERVSKIGRAINDLRILDLWDCRVELRLQSRWYLDVKIFSLRLFSSLLFHLPTILLISRMLAVFNKSVAEAPEALRTPDTASVSALPQFFASLHASPVTVNFGPSGFISYSLDKQNPLLPRYPVLCIFLSDFWFGPFFFSFFLSSLSRCVWLVGLVFSRFLVCPIVIIWWIFGVLCLVVVLFCLTRSSSLVGLSSFSGMSVWLPRNRGKMIEKLRI